MSLAFVASRSVKSQLKVLFESLCYLCYGERISTEVLSEGGSRYRINIAQDLYNRFEKEEFKFS